MPGYDTNKAAQEPQPVWADQWGAIALDSGTGQAGTVTNKNSERDAKNGALGDCGRNGASNCKIMLTYYNQCAAVAFGAGFSSMQSDASLDKAKDTALSRCEAKGASCKIVYTGCSVARRVR
jgi:hypothetical protein